MASYESPPATTTPGVFLADPIERPPSTSSTKDHEKPLGTGRRTLGLILLAFVIFSWTATNFLASAILADHSFSQPFFVSYVNTLFFIIPLPPALVVRAYRHPEDFREWREQCQNWSRDFATWGKARGEQGRYRGRRDSNEAPESLLSEGSASSRAPSPRGYHARQNVPPLLSLRATFNLSLEFCFLWFFGGYFLLACLEYTTVASSTILTSTASGFTLILGALMGVEKFTLRKVLSVVLCFIGIILVSSVDFSGKSSDDEHRGEFPEKSLRELTIGNTLALLAAFVYAIYIIRMKKRIPDERAVDMPIFFGFIGLANALLLLPGFFLLHWTGLEPFGFPTPGKVTWILLINALGSMLGDLAWAYAVLLTSPILVTVGLSMTIPLTLVGQMVLSGQTSTVLYWVGALIVALSFVVINQEEKKEDVGREIDDRHIG